MKKILTAIFIALGLIGVSAAQPKDLTRWVNPFIGTGGHGHTFPGATMPFGMVQLSPDTRIDNWDGSSGYHYSDDTIYGFSHTHLSGTGIPDYCDILFMPTVGSPGSPIVRSHGEKGIGSKFSHTNERAAPGYYSVKLDDYGILAELTATKRVGLHRYTFGTSGEATISLDLKWRDKVLDSELKIVGRNRIEGYRRSTSWAKDQIVYFVAEFSKPFSVERIGTGYDDERSFSFLNNRGNSIVARFGFNTIPGDQILLKVALSPVSIEGARKNLAAELPGWDFDKVRADAKAAWNKELSKIEVSGGTDAQTTTFYTALYHTMIQPNIFNDVDGKYLGMDKKVHSVRSADTPVRMSAASARKKTLAGGTGDADKSVRTPSEQYTVFSLWDTFRAAHPLYTIIDQKRTVDFINTFIRQYEQGGRLPVWELAGEETDTMIGYHAVSVIADAMAKGIKGFDYEKAYAAAKHSAELDHFGLAAYKKRGYISMEDENESVSKTLEYAYDDWCIAQIAMNLITERYREVKRDPALRTESRDADDRRISQEMSGYRRRSTNYQNLFDQRIGFMRPKKNGGFVEPFAPNEVTFGFTEGNSWQYSFFVPHDIDKLSRLYRGRGHLFVDKLDELFTTNQKLAGREQADLTGLIGQYAHGNEPSHHIPYLFNYVREPWKTQKYVRQIMDEFYKNSPDGLIGNEDCGQMSAWYVLSASGFYPVTPGSPVYDIGTPLFKEIRFNLENGNTFTVKAPGVSDKNIYVKSVKIDGKPAYGLYHGSIMKGGTLEFEMSPVAVESTLVGFSIPTTPDVPAVPLIQAQETGTTSRGTQTLNSVEKTFNTQVTVFLKAIREDSQIKYTLDGTDPSDGSPVYSKPITLDKATILKAVTVTPKGEKSLVAEAEFRKRPNDWTVKIISPYSTQYTGGGDNAIVDGIRGTVNFASGEWQGVQGKTYEAVIDLQRETPITELGGSFLQVAGPWIWMPDRIEFETSSDGITFTKATEIKTGFPQTEMTPTLREYRQKITPSRARYVRVRAFNVGKIPSWHPGAGGDPWIFVDEILVN
ncbi:MAG: GH92 family glycosyl hydrolase [Pyrinomonadaceae bacterium]|nr:GH92 family glycosyl hydrolase [Pyrinomonadaceae bacterium]MBP6211625.1 GH92 family glycosyl hydrolase [Pyrinomonadaceae bacterium]